MRDAINMQSTCNQHAITWVAWSASSSEEPMRDAISMQSGCNHLGRLERELVEAE